MKQKFLNPYNTAHTTSIQRVGQEMYYVRIWENIGRGVMVLRCITVLRYPFILTILFYSASMVFSPQISVLFLLFQE